MDASLGDRPVKPAKPKCKGHSAKTGKPCGKYPMRGQKVCAKHGGKSPQALAAAEQRVQLAAAQQSVNRLNLCREVNARQALEEELWRTAGVVGFLDSQVQAMREDDMVWGKTEQVEKQAGEFPGVDTTYAAVLNVWVKWWRDERDHLRRVTKDALSAGIEERRVKLAEQQGAMLSDVIKQILGDLDLTPEQQQAAPAVVVRHLRAIAGGLAG